MVVDLGHRGDRAPRVLAAGALIDGDRGLQALDQVDVGTFELMEELPGVDREAFDILALPLGIEGVEGQRALPRSAGSGDDDQFFAGNVEVEILEVVDTGPADADRLLRDNGGFRNRSTHALPRMAGLQNSQIIQPTRRKGRRQAESG